jgi:hypothetical protein
MRWVLDGLQPSLSQPWQVNEAAKQVCSAFVSLGRQLTAFPWPLWRHMWDICVGNLLRAKMELIALGKLHAAALKMRDEIKFKAHVATEFTGQKNARIGDPWPTSQKYLG